MLYHSARGSVNYTIVGSPAIVDGILENPNRQNYIKTDTTFQDTGEDFRLHVEFVRTLIRNVPVLGTNQTGGASPLLSLDAGKPRFRIGTGVNIYGVQSLWRTNTPYAIEVSRTGNIWTLKSFMNGNQVDIQTLESSALLNDGEAFTWVFGCDFAVYGGGIEGNIDLNKTYINYDKEAWFGICPIEVKKHQIMGPVGYTVVGSPTITDGVASGFSSSDYLELPSWKDEGQNLEIALTFLLPSDYPSYARTINECGSGINGSWLAVSAYKAGIYIRLNLNEIFSIPYSLQTETRYTAKLKRTTNTYTLELLDSQGNVLASDSFISNTLLYNGASFSMKLGYERSISGQPFPGSIDLNNTYIKVNGKLWYWQPRETEKIVVNGVEVWTKPQES